MKKIMQMIKIREVEDKEANLNFLRTKLDMDNEKIISSSRYTDEDIDNSGWDYVVNAVAADEELISKYNRGMWDLKYWRISLDIGTSMDGVKWITHHLSLNSEPFMSFETEEHQRKLRNAMILDMYESLILLGFTKHQFIQCLPNILQPVIRHELIKIRTARTR